MAYQGFNVRSAFIPRDGYYFVDVDWSQVEFRFSAMVAGEIEVLKGFAEGKDYYKNLTSLMFKIPYDAVTKAQRQTGKVVCLGQNYGQEKYGLARVLKCTPEVAQGVMDDFWAGQPRTKAAKERAVEETIRRGYVQTYLGRRRKLPDLLSNDRKKYGFGVRSVWSHIVQGSCADFLKIAMIRVRRALQGRDAYLILTVHDELLLEVGEKENFYEIVKIVAAAMAFRIPGFEDLEKQMHRAGYPDWQAVLPIEIEFGYSYGELYGEKKFLIKFGHRINTDSPSVKAESTLIPEHRKIDTPIVKPQKPKRSSKKEEVLMTGGIDHVLLLLGRNVGVVSSVPIQKAAAAEPVFVDSGDTIPKVESEPGSKQKVELEKISIDSAFASVQGLDASQYRQLPEQIPSTVAKPKVVEGEPKVFDGFVSEGGSLRGKDGTLVISPEQQEEQKRLDNAAHAWSKGDLAGPSDAVIKRHKELGLPSAEYHPKNNGKTDGGFDYPCVIAKVNVDLNEKRVKFFKALAKQFKGPYKLYLEYKGKIIELGPDFKVKPSKECIDYLKKGCGKNSEVEVYGQQGKPEKARVSFA